MHSEEKNEVMWVEFGLEVQSEQTESPVQVMSFDLGEPLVPPK